MSLSSVAPAPDLRVFQVRIHRRRGIQEPAADQSGAVFGENAVTAFAERQRRYISIVEQALQAAAIVLFACRLVQTGAGHPASVAPYIR
jgi:hypothetical protein